MSHTAVPPTSINTSTIIDFAPPCINLICTAVEILFPHSSKFLEINPYPAIGCNEKCLFQYAEVYSLGYRTGFSLGSKSSIVDLNIPLRSVGIYQALLNRKYFKAAAHVTSFVSLMFGTKGRTVSFVIDILAGIYLSNQNLSKKITEELSKKLDPTKPEDAAKILDLDSAKKHDYSVIKQKYDALQAKLADGLGQLEIPSPVATNLELQIQRARKAFETLTTDTKKS